MRDDKTLDPVALKALAHPLRIQLYELLLREGPQTATSLAKRLDETSGATSYHLRRLHRAGLIHEDPDRGTARERWWSTAQRSVTLSASALPDEPETQAAARWLARETQRRRNAVVEQWHATYQDWPQHWQDASVESGGTLNLTADQLVALRDEVMDVIERYRSEDGAQPAPGVETVAVIFTAIPQTDPGKDTPHAS